MKIHIQCHKDEFEKFVKDTKAADADEAQSQPLAPFLKRVRDVQDGNQDRPRPSNQDQPGPSDRRSPAMGPIEVELETVYVRSAPSATPPAPSPSPSALQQNIPFRPSKLTTGQIKTIDYTICEMMALDFEPFRIVEREGFTRLVNLLEPRYQLRSREYYKTSIMPDIASRVKDTIKTALADTEWMSFTTDIWSDTVSHTELMSLTCHYLDHDFQYKEFVLCASPLNDRHTGQYLATVIQGMFDSYEIPAEKIHMVMRDQGANMRKMGELAKINTEDCLAHKLQLVINDGLFSQAMVNNIIRKAKELATYFHSNLNAPRRLNQIQDELNRRHLLPLQDVPTRWNSTFDMLERLIAIKASVVNLSAEDKKVPTFTPDEWTLCSTVCSLLQPFRKITDKISGGTALISLTIPFVGMLHGMVSNDSRFSGAKTIVRVFKESIERRFADLEEKKHMVIATYLDPRFRGRNYSEPAVKDKAHSWIIEEVEGNAQQPPPPPPAAVRTEVDDPSSILGMLAAFTDSIAPTVAEADGEEAAQEGPTQGTVKAELLMFEAEPYANISDANFLPSAWWAIQKAKYPLLARLAQRYLSTPPTSVPSERLFSKAGQIYTKKRNRLTGENAERLLYLKSNLSKIDFKY